MKSKKDICVIGTGRFGNAVINQLIDLKINVLAIDFNEENLKVVSPLAKVAIVDATNIDALQSISIDKFKTVIVGATDNVEIVAALIEIGVDNVIAKAKNIRHMRVLKAIGVDVIIRPEAEAGIRAALIASNDMFIKYSENLQDIGDGYAMGSTLITSEKWANKAIKELHFNELTVSIVSIKRGIKVFIPNGDFVLLPNDQITIIGKIINITRAFGELNKSFGTQEINLNKAKNQLRVFDNKKNS